MMMNFWHTVLQCRASVLSARKHFPPNVSVDTNNGRNPAVLYGFVSLG